MGQVGELDKMHTHLPILSADKLKEPKTMYLCNPDGKPLSVVHAENRHLVLRFNDLSELTFTVPKLKETEDTYDLIATKRVIDLDDIGQFRIASVSETAEGEHCTKEVTAYSAQSIFKDKGFYTEERVYMFYNPNDNKDALYDANDLSAMPSVVGQLYQQLGIQIDLVPDDENKVYDEWTIVYINDDLKYNERNNAEGSTANYCRTFTEESVLGYDFMVNTVEDAFGVVFDFDFLHRAIRIDFLEKFTETTDVYLSFDNVVTSLGLTENAEEIVTVMNCEGSSLDIRTANPMGTNYIVNFDYYMREKDDKGHAYPWMSEELIGALKEWKGVYESKKADFEAIINGIPSIDGKPRVVGLYELLEQKAAKQENVTYANTKLLDMRNAQDQHLQKRDEDLAKEADGTGFITVETVTTDLSMLPNSTWGAKVFNDTDELTMYTEAPKPEKAPYEDADEYTYIFKYTEPEPSQEYPRPNTAQAALEYYIEDWENSEVKNSSYMYFKDDGDPYSFCKLVVKAEVVPVRDSGGNISKTGTVEINGVTYTVEAASGTLKVTKDGKPVGNVSSSSGYIWDADEKYRYKVSVSADGITTFTAYRANGFDRISTYASVVPFQGFKGTVDHKKSYPEAPGWVELWESKLLAYEDDLEELQNQIDKKENALQEIANACEVKAFIKGKSDKLYKELQHYWIEGNYTNDTLAITDETTFSERIDLSKELLAAGQKELARASQPSVELTVDAIAFYEMPEFKPFIDEMRLGRAITIERDDDILYEVALVSVECDLDTPEGFSLAFSSAKHPSDTTYTYADLIKKATATTRTVASNWSNLMDYTNNKAEVTSLISAPLDLSLRTGLSRLSGQEFVIDQTGILGRRLGSDNNFEPKQVRIINNQILFTNNAWSSAALALGEVTLNESGQTAYGLVADVLVGHLFLGDEMQIRNADSSIVLDAAGITIKDSTGQTAFSASPSGDVFVKGEIQATSGTIGGYTIGATDLTSGAVGMSSDKNADFAFWAGGDTEKVFSVSPAGVLKATEGKIGSLLIGTRRDTYVTAERKEVTAKVECLIPVGTVAIRDDVNQRTIYSSQNKFDLQALLPNDTDMSNIIPGNIAIIAGGEPPPAQGKGPWISLVSIDKEDDGRTTICLIGAVKIMGSAAPTFSEKAYTVPGELSIEYFVLSSSLSEPYSSVYTEDNTFNIQTAKGISMLSISSARLSEADICNMRSPEAIIGDLSIKNRKISYGGGMIDFAYGSNEYEAVVSFRGNVISVYVTGQGKPPENDHTFSILYKDTGSDFYKSTVITVKGGTASGRIELPIFTSVTEAFFLNAEGEYGNKLTEKLFCDTDNAISVDGVDLISSTGMDLGNAHNPWNRLFATYVGTYNTQVEELYAKHVYLNEHEISSSDRNRKNSIKYIENDGYFSDFFDALKPATFKFNDGTSGRTHMGLIAQDVGDSLTALGVSLKDNAVYCSWETQDDKGIAGETCGLRYTELIPLLIHEVQLLKKKVNNQ